MVSRYVQKYSQIIAENLAPRYIRFPRTEFERGVVKARFFQQYRFPGILGVVDGTHIQITAVPRQIENAYVNRKGFHSINTQIVCNAELSIININARFPGATHDAIIYNGSILNTHLERTYNEDPQTNNFIIGRKEQYMSHSEITMAQKLIFYLLYNDRRLGIHALTLANENISKQRFDSSST